MNPNITPAIGQIVHYTLSDFDVAAVAAQPRRGNPVHAGDIFSALILRAFGKTPESAVNLRVFLDGPGSDDLWVTSRTQGEGPAQWYSPVAAAAGERFPAPAGDQDDA